MKDQEYLKNRVTTANGPQLVALLYEETIKRLEKAVELMEKNQQEEVLNLINQCKDILAELLSTLEGNSDITKNLRSIYLYVNRLMTEAVNQKKASKLQEAIKVLTPLYEGWQQLGEDLQVSSEPQQATTRITGYTYGKGQLNDYVIQDENRWKKG